jgi:hypothetical protein
MSGNLLPDAHPTLLARSGSARASHSLLDAGGTAMLLILVFAFIAPTFVWVVWGPPPRDGLPAGIIELHMLLWSALLSLVLPVLQIGMHIRRYGGSLIRGNRDAYPRMAGVAGRIRVLMPT